MQGGSRECGERNKRPLSAGKTRLNMSLCSVRAAGTLTVYLMKDFTKQNVNLQIQAPIHLFLLEISLQPPTTKK